MSRQIILPRILQVGAGASDDAGNIVTEYSIPAAAQRYADCARAKRTQQDVSNPSTTDASNPLCLRGFSSRLPWVMLLVLRKVWTN
jgi:hypothetical protein